MRSQVVAVSSRVARLEKKCEDMANIDDVMGLSIEVSRLKKTLGDRVSGVEQEVRKGVAVNMIPDGLVGYWTRKCGGNVHEKGVITGTASCRDRPGCEAKNAVELGTKSYFCSRDKPNSWICYQFKSNVIPTSYSIRTHDGRYPKSWVLEFSGSGANGPWQVVDQHTNNEDLNAPYVTHEFRLTSSPGFSTCFVRLRQTGPNHDGDNSLCLNSFEVFGTCVPKLPNRFGMFPGMVMGY